MNLPMTAQCETLPISDAQNGIVMNYWMDMNKLLSLKATKADAMRTQIIAELDRTFPLNTGSHADVSEYVVYFHQLLAFFDDGSSSGLRNPGQLQGLTGSKNCPTSLLLKEDGLFVELELKQVGRDGRALENLIIEGAFAAVDNETSARIPTITRLLQQADNGMEIPGSTARTFRALDGEDFKIHNRQ